METEAFAAAETLRSNRSGSLTMENIEEEAEKAARMTENAATEALQQLHNIVNDFADGIPEATDEACRRIEETVEISIQRILEAKESSISSFRILMGSYYRGSGQSRG